MQAQNVLMLQKLCHDKAGYACGVVEVKERHIRFHEGVAGNGDKGRIMVFATTEKGGAPFTAVHLDLGEVTLLEPFGEHDINITKIGGDKLA